MKMRKCLAIFLTIALIVTIHGNALAGTLNLPAKVTRISKECYMGTKSLDVVDITYGTTEIDERAFANSSVRRVYIPSTVVRIADSAFEGTSVTILSSPGTYAERYAADHNLSWENCGTHYPLDVYQVQETVEETPETETFSFQESQEHVPSDGYTDPEDLAAIQSFNEQVDVINAAIEEYNSDLNAFIDDTQALAAGLSGLKVYNSGDSVCFSFDGTNMKMDRPLFEKLSQASPSGRYR